MLILHSNFRVCAQQRNHAFIESILEGPVVDLQIVFERWLKPSVLHAEAIFDSGADCTLVSYRWLTETYVAQMGSSKRFYPPVPNPVGEIVERACVRMGGTQLVLPRTTRIARQGGVGRPLQFFADMPGYEDIILGRDFLRDNGLMLAIDGHVRDTALVSDLGESKLRTTVRAALGVTQQNRP